ncbi:hypothetical protein TNCV_1666281 [Trichonephila clavipes]|nr:hypothetical protein TNCV_1666281 [Trichonephila clavipes]
MNQGLPTVSSKLLFRDRCCVWFAENRCLVHAPMLTAVHRQRRLEFSYRYRNWASNERRQDGGIYQQDIAGVIQLTAYVRGSKSTRISLSFFRVQKTHLT